jgi:glycosyltransferase involved in cell wall biosynthesis
MIHIIATAVKSGKGGISTALIGFCESDTLRDAGINIIESHNDTKPKLQSFRAAAQRIRDDVKPGDVVWIHCARWVSMVRKYLLAYLAKRQGAKVFIQFHSTITSNYTETVPGRFLLRRLYAISDGVCVLSEWWRRLLVRKLNFDSDHIHIVPNPLDKSFERLAKINDYRAPQKNAIHLLSMTRLVEGKNVGAVIEAMVHLPDTYHLTVAGDGPLLDGFKKRVKQLQLQDRVIFTGWVDYEQKINLLKQQDLFVLPSQYDAFGMGFLEAMSAGLPVVALRTGPTSDVVPHGRAGILVDNCQPENLAQAVEAALDEHKRFSLAARHYVATNYPADTILPSLLRFFAGSKA